MKLYREKGKTIIRRQNWTFTPEDTEPARVCKGTHLHGELDDKTHPLKSLPAAGKTRCFQPQTAGAFRHCWEGHKARPQLPLSYAGVYPRARAILRGQAKSDPDLLGKGPQAKEYI